MIAAMPSAEPSAEPSVASSVEPDHPAAPGRRAGTGPVTASPVVLRAATAADVGDVIAFWREAAEGTDRADSPEGVLRLLARDPEALILAVEGDRIVGSLIAGWDGWRCHLYRFAVHPERRRRGIGRAMLAVAERRFAAAGAARVDAMVLDGNTLAHGAWAAAGYRPQPEWTRWVRRLPVRG